MKTCNRLKCKLQHIKLEDLKPITCIVCTENVTVETFGAADCGHKFCLNCAYQLLHDEDRQLKVLCPVCRRISEYKN